MCDRLYCSILFIIIFALWFITLSEVAFDLCFTVNSAVSVYHEPPHGVLANLKVNLHGRPKWKLKKKSEFTIT